MSLELARSILMSSAADFGFYFNEAEQLTHSKFGLKRCLLNPLYYSNYCISDCIYCSFRTTNKVIERKNLNKIEFLKELEFLNQREISHILLVSGELSPRDYFKNLQKYLNYIPSNLKPKWLGVEAALKENEFVELNAMGIDCVNIFQETYNNDTYKELHKLGNKVDFQFRYMTQFRAAKAGISEVGFGVLYGIDNWINDTIKMIEHAEKVKDTYPTVKLMFSFPKIILSPFIDNGVVKEKITEEILMRAITTVRIIFPDADIVLTGREDYNFLLKAVAIANIIGKGGSTEVGGYCVTKSLNESNEQFPLKKEISFVEFKELLMEKHYV